MSVKNIVDNLMEGIKFYINERIKFAPYDKTDTAIVKGISEFGYVISYNNVLYSDIKTIGGTCSINETVKIMIPQNNMNNIFILKPPNGDNNYVSNDKITNSGTINTTGWVADARQLNPSISNTLAWNIAQTNSNLNNKQDKITYIEARIQTIANVATLISPTSVIAGDIPPSINFVPLVTEYSHTDYVPVDVYAFNNAWWVYTSVAQQVIVRFYKMD